MKLDTLERRDFLRRVGQGMLVASVGPGLAHSLGNSTAQAADGETRLTFGDLEPLVTVMQETPIDRLQPLIWLANSMMAVST